MYKKNRIKEMIDNGQISLGMQCFTEDPALLEIMGLAAFDYVILDNEHSGGDPRAMEPLIRAADSVGVNRSRFRSLSQCLPSDGRRTGEGRSWCQVYAARKEELGLRPAHQTADIFGREKWPEPLNFFEVETFSKLKPKQSNPERN